MTLTPQNRDNIVNYRLERAYESLQQAKSVINLLYWNLAANRMYYAVYYVSSALLIKNGIEASSHKGVINQIGQSFVLTGVLCRSDSKLLNTLFSMRQSGDYEDLFDWEERYNTTYFSGRGVSQPGNRDNKESTENLRSIASDWVLL